MITRWSHLHTNPKCCYLAINKVDASSHLLLTFFFFAFEYGIFTSFVPQLALQSSYCLYMQSEETTCSSTLAPRAERHNLMN